MDFLNTFLPIVIYILLVILLVLLIVLIMRISKTMDKVDKLVDDANSKMEKIDPVFDLVEGVSTKANLISDRFLGFILKITNKLFKKDDKEE